MVRTAGPEHVDSLHHEAWILKRIALIQTVLIGSAQRCYSHLPIKIKKIGQRFAENFKRPQ